MSTTNPTVIQEIIMFNNKKIVCLNSWDNYGLSRLEKSEKKGKEKKREKREKKRGEKGEKRDERKKGKLKLSIKRKNGMKKDYFVVFLESLSNDPRLIMYKL